MKRACRRAEAQTQRYGARLRGIASHPFAMPDLATSQARAVQRLAAVCTAYLGAVAALLLGVLYLHGHAVTVATWIVCALGPLLAAALWMRPVAAARERTMSLVAASLFAPILQLFWVASQPAEPAALAWSLGAVGLLHALAFAGGIAWAGQATTGVDAPPGRAAVPLAALRERVLRLAESLRDIRLERVDAASLVVALDEGPGRVHRIELRFDADRHCARVREHLTADRAAPRDAAEASMRRPGDPLVDAARPAARRVSGRTRQATLIDPRRLEALRRQVDPAWGGVAPAAPGRLDGEGLVTLLCALVTTSGWHWRPELI